MIDNIEIREIMTSPVVTLDPYDTMERVADIFKNQSFHHIPIVDDNGRVLGMISRLDYHKVLNAFSIFNTVSSRMANESTLRSLLVKEVMTKQLATLRASDPISKAFAYFRENLFHAVPIVNDEKELEGIVTTFDLLNYAYREVV